MKVESHLLRWSRFWWFYWKKISESDSVTFPWKKVSNITVIVVDLVVRVTERFNNLLGKDSLPHNLFIHVTQQSAHCVTRQKRLRGRLRNTVIWLDISEILFTSGLVWKGTWLYTKGAFHPAKILFETSEIPCAKPTFLLYSPNASHCTFVYCTQ